MKGKRVYPLIVGLVIYWLATMLWYTYHWGGPTYKAMIGDLIFLPLGVAVGTAIWWSAGDPAVAPEAHRAWRRIALASWALGVGNWVWFFSQHVVGANRFTPCLTDDISCITRSCFSGYGD